MQNILMLITIIISTIILLLTIIAFAPQIYLFFANKFISRKERRENAFKINRLVQIKLLDSSNEIEEFLKANLNHLSDEDFKLLINRLKELKKDEVIYYDVNTD